MPPRDRGGWVKSLWVRALRPAGVGTFLRPVEMNWGGRMNASPPAPVPPLVRALQDVREVLERARRTGDRREIEAAIERINAAFDERR